MVHRYHLCAVALLCALLGLVIVPAAGARAGAPPYQTCSNVILNGGFETTGNWALGPGPLLPIYVNSPVYSGSWAMQTGSPGPTTNVANSWIYQRITIPNNAVSADLAFWVWLESAPNPGADVQQALLMIPGSTDLSQPFQPIWSAQANAPAWQKIAASLINQKGRTLDLYFNVYNDGVGGNTAMILDNVTLTICQPAATPSPPPSVTPWPTLTPTPLSSSTPFPTPSPVASVTASPSPGATPFPTPAGSATPTPSDCVDIIRNGGFEWDGDWAFGWDPLLPFYNGNAAFVHSGARSMAQGAVNQQPVTTPAYSSIRQDITLPAGAATANITFWYYPLSNAAADGLSRQELILLDPLAYDETVEVLWRTTENSQTWQQSPPIDLTQYLGRTLSVYFNARNAGDGTWTGMYLDDVSLAVCGGAVAVVLPEVIATAAPVVQANGANPVTEQQVAAAVTGATVISVSPVATTEADVFSASATSSDDGSSDEPRRERQPLFDGNIDTRTVLIILGILALLAVLAIFFWWRRRDDTDSSSPSTPIDGPPSA